jgi:hypothetical protein
LRRDFRAVGEVLLQAGRRRSEGRNGGAQARSVSLELSHREAREHVHAPLAAEGPRRDLSVQALALARLAARGRNHRSRTPREGPYVSLPCEGKPGKVPATGSRKQRMSAENAELEKGQQGG